MQIVLDNIKYFREVKRFSRKDIAVKLGISNSLYYKIETGSVELTVDRLYQISILLKTPIEVFFCPDPEKANPDNISIKEQIENLKRMCNKNELLINSLSENIRFLKENMKPKSKAKK